MSAARGHEGASRQELGAALDHGGADFSVVSLIAESVDLCLFEESGREERVALEAGEGGRWHARVEGVTDRQRYGYRVAGPYEVGGPARCDHAKLLVDPYARALTGAAWLHEPAMREFGIDSAAVAPRSLVVDGTFDWGDDDAKRPRRAWEDTVIYEVHVKGATMRHHGVPAAVRGTYEALGSASFVEHLVDLGVTTVELLPVHELADEAFLSATGRTNYWGYNSIGFFAPAARYSAAVNAGDSGGQVREFKSMVKTLHAAGLEVVLDVVYNHTCESDARGPTVSLRGLDAPTYYRHDSDGSLLDTTGCGNSINAQHPVALGLVLDSLRYWAEECHVDGFRFDLAPTLARPRGDFDPTAPFLQLCADDTVLRDVKLIVEPWDVGQPDSYALGRFPPPFREWNGQFRDVVRDFWRSEDGLLAELATCFSGSSDLFESPGRAPTSSVNFVTAHDGFTLSDLVSYDDKHNEENGEDNEDGTDDNRSWNCGAEGETDDAAITALRGSQARALLATLVLSCGVPMVLGGDELGRTQLGNNNAYCQDNELSWLDWDCVDVARLEFTRRMLALRGRYRALRRRRFVGRGSEELAWFTPAGAPMAHEDWLDPTARCVAIRLEAARTPQCDPGTEGALDDELLVLVNGWWEPVDFVLPDVPTSSFELVVDTFDPRRPELSAGPRGTVSVSPRSIVVLATAAAARDAGG